MALGSCLRGTGCFLLVYFFSLMFHICAMLSVFGAPFIICMFFRLPIFFWLLIIKSIVSLNYQISSLLLLQFEMIFWATDHLLETCIITFVIFKFMCLVNVDCLWIEVELLEIRGCQILFELLLQWTIYWSDFYIV